MNSTRVKMIIDQELTDKFEKMEARIKSLEEYKARQQKKKVIK